MAQPPLRTVTGWWADLAHGPDEGEGWLEAGGVDDAGTWHTLPRVLLPEDAAMHASRLPVRVVNGLLRMRPLLEGRTDATSEDSYSEVNVHPSSALPWGYRLTLDLRHHGITEPLHFDVGDADLDLRTIVGTGSATVLRQAETFEQLRARVDELERRLNLLAPPPA